MHDDLADSEIQTLLAAERSQDGRVVHPSGSIERLVARGLMAITAGGPFILAPGSAELKRRNLR